MARLGSLSLPDKYQTAAHRLQATFVNKQQHAIAMTGESYYIVHKSDETS
jgi:hypothetical protein